MQRKYLKYKKIKKTFIISENQAYYIVGQIIKNNKNLQTLKPVRGIRNFINLTQQEKNGIIRLLFQKEELKIYEES